MKNLKNFEDFTNESLFGGVKKALSFDTSYNSEQDAWQQINDFIHKKYPQLKNINGGPGFTNGGNEIKIYITDLDYNKKTIKLNGQLVNQDDLKNAVINLLKTNHII